jgi:hypothetical protein
MPAANTDKFRKSYSFTQKTLNGSITDSDTTLTLNNATNLPTDTAVSFVIDRVDSNGNLTPNTRELMTGVVSGSTITNLLRGEHSTTAQAHANGAVVEFVNSGKAHNDLIDGLIADHSQSGGHEIAINYDPSNPTLEIQKWAGVASAVNELTVTNAATGNAPKLAPTGGDTNVNLNLQGKGTGSVQINGTDILGTVFDHVVSGIVITADSAGVNKNYSISSGVVCIGGNFLTVAAVSAQTVAASKDRYIDLRDNGDGTAAYITNEVNNNAASQALTAGDMRVGIVVAGATFITNAGSINQGQEDKVLPIASSIAYAVTDSLGNLICPRDPQRKLLGYRQVIANIGSLSSTTATQIVGLACPVIVPTGRKVKLTLHIPAAVPNANAAFNGYIFDGTIGGGGTQVATTSMYVSNSQASGAWIPGVTTTPASASKTYNAGYAISTGSLTLGASATSPIFIKVELE